MSGLPAKVVEGHGNQINWEWVVQQLGLSPLGFANVKDFGAKGDGVTDDTQAIQRAIDTGRPVYFPPGTYIVSAPIELRDKTSLLGTHTPEWWQDPDNTVKGASSTLGPKQGTIIAPATGFAVPSDSNLRGILRAVDKEVSGAGSGAWGVKVSGIAVDGRDVGTNLSGLLLHGQSVDPLIAQCEFSNCSGSGLRTRSHQRSDGNWYNPQNGRFIDVWCRNNDAQGFHIEPCPDSTLLNCWSHRNVGYGYFFAGGGHEEIISCKAEWNSNSGFRTQGGCSGRSFITCRTDRNERFGYDLAHNQDTPPTLLTGCYSYRDGREGGLGGGSFAGLRIGGSLGNKVGPVIVTGWGSSVGNDGGATPGTDGPQYGIVLEYTQYVSLDGIFWGRQAGILDNGNNDQIRYGLNFNRMTGTEAAPSISSLHRPVGLVASAATDEILTARYFGDTSPNWGLTGSGAMRMSEQTDPAAPAANNGIVFIRDNGAGKTQLCVRFPTGAVQVIATEP